MSLTWLSVAPPSVAITELSLSTEVALRGVAGADRSGMSAVGAHRVRIFRGALRGRTAVWSAVSDWSVPLAEAVPSSDEADKGSEG
ncbi:uncharacterized protein BcabD6B2_53550 [Babesia caballi]|uniref:Secreted protein n=1 Tax=Babesia caballi TaxID=5871 RepID=A0AAV4M128_BABCB|nr:hypothetical protein BcabD6B2_53550 [Babesia caballi]